MSEWFGSKSELSAIQQHLKLKRDFPDGFGSVNKGRLVWRQQIKPTAISRSYSVRVALLPSLSPKVYVDEPCLADLAEGRKLPHVYEQKPARLCLYLPSCGEWSHAMFLSDTIIPWASLWLFYFEDWLITDEWKGGGVHPKTKTER